MKKLNFALIMCAAAASVLLAVILHRNARVKLHENETASQRQREQLHELTAQQQKLSNQLAHANSSTNSSLQELEKLRHQAPMLQKQANELGAQLQSNRQGRASQPAAKPQPRPPEYYAQLHRTAGAKGRDAKDLSGVFLMYAWDHQGRFPSSFDQVAGYLQKEKIELSGTNQFDIVYHGSLDELKSVPRGAVALIRDQQTWIAPSGKQARVYGLADGSSQIIESDDDFKAWEAEHIVSSVPAGQ